MKRTLQMWLFLLLLPLTGFLSAAYAQSENGAGFMEGDVLFQKLTGGQNYAVTLVTGSRYTHCGIILEHDGELAVYEAIGPVRRLPIDAWIAQGQDGHFVAMRLKDPDWITPAKLLDMRQKALELQGLPYDLRMEWSDDAIYCSELIWKIYERGANIILADLRPFWDYDNVMHHEVQRLAKERFALEIPWDELAVAPADLMQSPLLEVVAAN